MRTHLAVLITGEAGPGPPTATRSKQKEERMDTPLDTTDAAMLKDALKSLTSEQLAYALDAGVRLLEAWRVPIPTKLFTSGRAEHMGRQSQPILAILGAHRPFSN